jgi:hypothetical protein
MDEEDYDLTSIGCGELKINSLVRTQDISGSVPDFQFIKTLQPIQTQGGSEFYIPHSLFVNGDEVYIPVLEKGNAMNDGSYATIYKGYRSIYIPDLSSDDKKRTMEGALSFRRASERKEICIKSVPIELYGKEARSTPQTRGLYYYGAIQDLVNEAIIHGLIQRALERSGFPSSVPIMHEIVALTHDGTVKQLTNPMDVKEVWLTMEILNGMTLQRFLKRKLVRLPTKFRRSMYQLMKEKENELLILDVCFQMCCYLDILQEKLRFNHRDMKIDNAFCRYHPQQDSWAQNIIVKDMGTWKCIHDFLLIDFGFGCISCGAMCDEDDAISCLLASNTWFDTSSTCLKYGRDIAQFLYGLHASYPLKEYISQELFDVMDGAMIAVETDSFMKPIESHHLFAGVNPDGKPSPIGKSDPLPDKIYFHKGIYTYLKRELVDVPGCRPKTLLQTLGNYAAKYYNDQFITAISANCCLFRS